MDAHEPGADRGSWRLYDLDSTDPDGVLTDRTGLGDDDVHRINDLMAAFASLRRAEDEVARASERYMRLNRTDMRALHYLITAEHRDQVVTAGAVAAHLGISTASTTKLLDRLERAGHITRHHHPTDRRALAIRCTPATRETAIQTVGRQHAGRFRAARRLSPGERETVIRFLEDTTRELALGDEDWGSGPEPATDPAGQRPPASTPGSEPDGGDAGAR